MQCSWVCAPNQTAACSYCGTMLQHPHCQDASCNTLQLQVSHIVKGPVSYVSAFGKAHLSALYCVYTMVVVWLQCYRWLDSCLSPSVRRRGLLSNRRPPRRLAHASLARRRQAPLSDPLDWPPTTSGNVKSSVFRLEDTGDQCRSFGKTGATSSKFFLYIKDE